MEELTILNPFVVGKYVSPHFFCDREVETQWLMKQIAPWKSHSTLTLLATQNYPFLLKYDCPLWLK